MVLEIGVPVAKMSGRGLGHTGGTVDKLESIPGMQMTVSREAFLDQCDRIGLAIIGQSGNMTPADKKLYALRWGVETAFRTLKYTLGLLHLHAKKVEHILQEIFACLIMYNFSQLITSHIIIQREGCKLTYKVNFAAAIHISRQFFLGNVSPPIVETLLQKYVSPIRPGRNFFRSSAKKKRSLSFVYRIA